MFALAIWDSRRRKLVLARDRLGKKPLYYFVRGSRVIFGSELKALLAHGAVPRELDAEALVQYLACEYVPAPASILRSVRKLPAAHVAVLDERGFRLRRYWQVPPPSHERITAKDAAQELFRLLDRAVAKRLVADVPVGVFLSGGIDSTSIAALAVRHKKPLQTFSIGFVEESFDESPWARLAAERLGTDHVSEKFSGQDCLDLIPAAAAQLDEPFADPSFLPTLLLSRFTRKHVKVALAGDGGDELFAGYDPFLAHRPASLVARFPNPVRAALRTVVQHLPVSSRNMSLDFRLKQFLRGVDAEPSLRHAAWFRTRSLRAPRRDSASPSPPGSAVRCGRCSRRCSPSARCSPRASSMSPPSASSCRRTSTVAPTCASRSGRCSCFSSGGSSTRRPYRCGAPLEAHPGDGRRRLHRLAPGEGARGSWRRSRHRRQLRPVLSGASEAALAGRARATDRGRYPRPGRDEPRFRGDATRGGRAPGRARRRAAQSGAAGGVHGRQRARDCVPAGGSARGGCAAVLARLEQLGLRRARAGPIPRDRADRFSGEPLRREQGRVRGAGADVPQPLRHRGRRAPFLHRLRAEAAAGSRDPQILAPDARRPPASVLRRRFHAARLHVGRRHRLRRPRGLRCPAPARRLEPRLSAHHLARGARRAARRGARRPGRPRPPARAAGRRAPDQRGRDARQRGPRVCAAYADPRRSEEVRGVDPRRGSELGLTLPLRSLNARRGGSPRTRASHSAG